MILAAPVLGGQDPLFAAVALAAVLALMGGRLAAASALTVAAGLVKPQGALLLPALLFVMAREARPRDWARAFLGGLGVAALVLLPWWSAAHLLSALDGCRRTLTQTALSAQGLNLWWMAGWAMDWAREGPWPVARIRSVMEFREWAGWDPRPLAWSLLLAATVAMLVSMRRWPASDRRIILAVILQVRLRLLRHQRPREPHLPGGRPRLPAARIVAAAGTAVPRRRPSCSSTCSSSRPQRRGPPCARWRICAWRSGSTSRWWWLLHAVLLAALFAWVGRPRATRPRRRREQEDGLRRGP